MTNDPTEPYHRACKERDEALASLRGKAKLLTDVCQDIFTADMRTKVNSGNDDKTITITYGPRNMMVNAHEWLNFDEFGRLLNKYHRAKHAAEQAWDALPDGVKQLAARR